MMTMVVMVPVLRESPNTPSIDTSSPGIALMEMVIVRIRILEYTKYINRNEDNHEEIRNNLVD